MKVYLKIFRKIHLNRDIQAPEEFDIWLWTEPYKSTYLDYFSKICSIWGVPSTNITNHHLAYFIL